MCGIFGYVGQHHDVGETVGSALRSLEYRGYDSWGIVWDQGERLETVKRIGRVPASLPFRARSSIAVGHTRWATHGAVTDANAHPHLDCTGRIAIVHNGIIENAHVLHDDLALSHTFSSETDSEIVAHLIEDRLAGDVPVLDALIDVFPRLEGQNAIIALDHRAHEIAAVMNISPLVIGTGPQGSYIASDPFALWGKCELMTVVPNGSFVRMRGKVIDVFDAHGSQLPTPPTLTVPSPESDVLGDYPHYMAKEMAEQADVLGRLTADTVLHAAAAERIRSARNVVLTGCGTAHFAARLTATWLNEVVGLPAVAVPASEFGDIRPFVGPDTVVVGFSQSGETADLLEALETARKAGSYLIGVVNVVHSSAARFVDVVLPIHAGRERSVLATKSFTAMLGTILSVTHHLAGDDIGVHASLLAAAETLRDLEISEAFIHGVNRIATVIAAAPSALVIGRGTGYSIAQEAALKIKEASYVHAEAFAAGELKHGAIALVEEGTPCVVCMPDPAGRGDLLRSAQELRSRGGYTMGIGVHVPGVTCDGVDVPDVGIANPIVHAFVVQQIAYRVALLRGLDPDYPRNLAKSVTVK